MARRRTARSDTERDAHEQRVLYELVREIDGDLGASLAHVTSAGVHTLGVTRVGLWVFGPDGTTLTCRACTALPPLADATGARLEGSRYPGYFAALSRSRVLAATEARKDRRTRELALDYLEPQGIVSMLDVPVWCGGTVVGVLCHEVAGDTPRPWSPADQRVAGSFADVVGLALGAAERHALAAEDARLRAKLTEERAFLDQVLRQIPIGVIISEADGRVRFANDLAVALWGHRFRPGEGGIEALEVLHADGTPVPRHALPHVRAAREGAVVSAVLWIRAGDAHRALRCFAGPLLDPDERIVGVVLACADITATEMARRLERESAQLRDRLLEFLGHDLRNPLTVITLLADAQRRRTDGNPRRSAERILAAAWRMRSMLRDAVDYARASSGVGLQILATPTDLDAICRRVVREVGAAVPERRITYEAHGATTGTWDPERMEQAASTLLLHAIQHASPESEVRLALHGVDATVDLEVRCAGEPEEMTRLGAGLREDEPLPAAPEDDPLVRLVLGVRLVREIAQAHGGAVSLSDDGVETAIRLRLPRQPPSEPPQRPRA